MPIFRLYPITKLLISSWISSSSVFGMSRTVEMYVIWLINFTLAIVMRPRNERLYGFHVDIIFFILSLTSLKFCSKFFSFESNNVKESFHFMPRSGQSWLLMFVFVPIGITTVLSRLQARPEILWNCVMYFAACLRLCSLLLMKIVVSSAKVSLRDSCCAYGWFHLATAKICW